MTGSDASPDPAAVEPGARRAPWRAILTIVGVGVGLRAGLLYLALPIDIQSDEANYLYLALVLERFGIYLDQHRYLWPPGYPWLLQTVVGDGGTAGLTLFRGLQVALSSVIGATTMLFAWRLFSTRAAIVAGLLWTVHLPLAAFTHLLWNETVFLALFLPALWHILVALDRGVERQDGAAQGRLVVAGVLMGLALHVKEMPLFLLVPLGLVCAWRAWPLGRGAALRHGTLLPLAALVTALPWTARNAEVYGRVVIGGATLGENVYQGLNARHANFDLIPLHKERARRGLPPLATLERGWFTAPPADAPAGWERAETVVHPIDRHGVQLWRGLAYAAEHPGWLARTRLKKWSELVTPLSFFTRHQALGHYGPESGIGGPWRVPLVVLSLLTSVAVLAGSVLGAALTLQPGNGRALVGVVAGYVALVSLLVSMSRFRAPVEPLLIVLAAGLLAHGPVRRGPAPVAAAAAGLAALAGLWWISLPETIAAASMALEAAP